MHISILTTFPDMLSPLNESILGRAQQNGIITIETINIRDYSENKHKNTDDYPYGGGCGMLMMPQPIFSAISAVEEKGYTGRKIYLSPRGRKLTQEFCEELSKEENLILLCGHYEGVDQRVIDTMEEVSIGDYVLTSGELAAMILVDSVSRLVPGVLGDENSHVDESFSSGLLEYPQYTRPSDYMGMKVPEVLLNGNHAQIAKWRRQESLKNTFLYRKDLLEKANLTKEDIEYLKTLEIDNE